MTAAPQVPPPPRPWDRPTVVRDLYVSLTLLVVGAFLWALYVVATLLAPPVGPGDMLFHEIVGAMGSTMTWMGGIFAAWNWSLLRRHRTPVGNFPPPVRFPSVPTALAPPPGGFPPPPAITGPPRA